MVWVSGGRILNAGLAFLTGVIITRTLGPAQYGLFFFSVTILTVTLELAANQGLNNSLVYFASFYLERDSSQAERFFKVAFVTKAGAALLLLVVSLLVVDPVFAHLFHRSELKEFIWFGIVGACITSLWWYTLAVLQAYRSFNKYTLLHLIPNGLTFLLITLLAFNSLLTLMAALYVKVFGFLAGFLVGLLFIPHRFLHLGGQNRSTGRKLLHYSKWTIAANLLIVFYQRQDIIFLGFLAEPTTLGHYAAAATIAASLYLLYEAAVTVLLPNASRLSSPAQYRDFVRKSFLMSGGLCLAVTPILIWSEPLIVTIYTEDFLPSVPIFRLLFIGLIFTILLETQSVILYAIQKPQWITAVNFLVIIIYATGNMMLIPTHGAIGAAAMSVVSRLISGLMISILVFYAVIRMKPEETEVIPYFTSAG